jgi:catechol 2,3-dioxygenase-like lactoylglutathione lyase family enzyme
LFDHIGINVRDYRESRGFYERALAPLGYGVVMEFGHACAFGRDGKPSFWVVQREPRGTGTHVAFAVGDRATVDAFHEAALGAGGSDYGAFVHDPDGNNVEAVCHH